MKIIIASSLLPSAVTAAASTTAAVIDHTRRVATTDSGRRVGASMHGWFTRLDGEMVPHRNTVPVDIPFEKVFDNLKFACNVSSKSQGQMQFHVRSFLRQAVAIGLRPAGRLQITGRAISRCFITYSTTPRHVWKLADIGGFGLSSGTIHDVISHGLLLGFEYKL